MPSCACERQHPCAGSWRCHASLAGLQALQHSRLECQGVGHTAAAASRSSRLIAASAVVSHRPTDSIVAASALRLLRPCAALSPSLQEDERLMRKLLSKARAQAAQVRLRSRSRLLEAGRPQAAGACLGVDDCSCRLCAREPQLALSQSLTPRCGRRRSLLLPLPRSLTRTRRRAHSRRRRASCGRFWASIMCQRQTCRVRRIVSASRWPLCDCRSAVLWPLSLRASQPASRRRSCALVRPPRPPSMHSHACMPSSTH